ncbi:hypothetical protein B0H14DRAFT_2608983 [Mycena olivaceomarginata]|nr:hypothetical protein B0H14DRAFT_2608983 [Mycena olivaceomarginata]
MSGCGGYCPLCIFESCFRLQQSFNSLKGNHTVIQKGGRHHNSSRCISEASYMISCKGQRDFAAAVLLPHAAAAATALQRQSAVVGLVAHVELLGIAVISGFKGIEHSTVTSVSF